jgi:hypothetical protein
MPFQFSQKCEISFARNFCSRKNKNCCEIFVKTVNFCENLNIKVSWISRFYILWDRTAGTGQLIQDNLDKTTKDRTAWAWQPGEDNLGRTTRIGPVSTDWSERSAVSCHPGQDREERMARTCQQGQGGDRTTGTGQLWQDSQHRTAGAG